MTPEDAEFLKAFESCTLAPECWTHTAHIHMAWLCLGASDFPTALARIRTGIRRYNAEVLDKLPEYHETVTVAFARLIASRMREGQDWQGFAASNEDLFVSSPPSLGAYYSSHRLMSAAARRSFVEPDLQPLPDLP